jgi:hypothetical protein
MSETQGNDLFNPAHGKLNTIRECLGQLEAMLPASEEEYVKANSMTHSCVKSCFLMIMQRTINTNHRVIEVAGGSPSYHNQLQTFLALQIIGAIGDDTFGFFQAALELYPKVVNQDSTEGEIYRIARGLLKYGGTYISQIEDFFAKSGERLKPTNPVTKRKADSAGSGTNPVQGEAISSSASVPTTGTPIG